MPVEAFFFRIKECWQYAGLEEIERREVERIA